MSSWFQRSIAVATLLAGCEHDGRVLVVVDTDYAVPSEIDLVRASVEASTGLRQERDFVIARRVPPPHADSEAVPLSFAIEARDSGSGDFEVEVSGWAPGGSSARVRRRAITGFRPGHTLVLPLPLLRSCEGDPCAPDRTCVDGECVDPRVAVESLDVLEQPGRELLRDAGSWDGGLDPRDAGDASTATGCSTSGESVVIDLDGDWDPTTTEDDAYLVWSPGTLGLHYAERGPDGFEIRGPLGLPAELTDTNSAVISPDGLHLVLTATRMGVRSIHQVSRATRDEPFAMPIDVAVDPAVHDPALDRSGLRLVARATLGGNNRLVRSSRTSRSEPFAPVEEVVELRDYDPLYPALSADGLTLMFTSRYMRASEDIFVVRRTTVDAPFGTPAVVEGASTSTDEHDPWISYDGTKLYFSRLTGADWDVWVADLACR